MTLQFAFKGSFCMYAISSLANIYFLKKLYAYILFFSLQATIARNAKDTAHTKAERNILECVKVSNFYTILKLAIYFLPPV